MKSGKLITGITVGAVLALILIPQTRKMIADAVSSITDSFNDMMDKTNGMAEKGKNEINTIAEKTKNIVGATKSSKDVWQS